MYEQDSVWSIPNRRRWGSRASAESISEVLWVVKTKYYLTIIYDRPGDSMPGKLRRWFGGVGGNGNRRNIQRPNPVPVQARRDGT